MSGTDDPALSPTADGSGQAALGWARWVRAGRDAYAALGEAFAEQRTGADNWLAKHP